MDPKTNQAESDYSDAGVGPDKAQSENAKATTATKSMESGVAEGDDDKKKIGIRQKIEAERFKLINILDVSLFEHLLDDHLQKAMVDIKEKKPKVRRLITELLSSDDHTLHEFCQVIAGLYPDQFKLLTGRAPTDAESDYCIHTFRDETRDSIRRNIQSHIETETSNLEDRFVRRHIADDTSSDCTNTAGDDLLGPDGKASTSVIHGGPGVGKTWTLHWFMEQWSKGLSAAECPCMVLLDVSSLANLTVPITLNELLMKHTSYPVPADQPQLPVWIRKRPQQITVLFDNADGLENNTKLRQIDDRVFKTHALDWCAGLLNGNVLPGCCKVVTSRACGELRERQSARLVTLTDLEWPDVQEFIQKNVPSDKRKKVLHTLDNNDTLVSLCRIPLFCSMLCRVLQESDSESLTYTRIASQLLLDTTLRVTDKSLGKAGLAQTLRPLARLAGIKPSKNVTSVAKTQYQESDFQKAKVTKKERLAIESCGILTYQDITDSSGNVQHVAEFIHPIFEVLFSVGNLLQNPDCDIVEAFTKMTPMGRYLIAGVTQDISNEAIAVLKETLEIPESAARDAASEHCIKEHINNIVKDLDEPDNQAVLEANQLTLESQSLAIAKETHALSGTLNLVSVMKMEVLAREFVMKCSTREDTLMKGDDFEKQQHRETEPVTDSLTVSSLEIAGNDNQHHQEEESNDLSDVKSSLEDLSSDAISQTIKEFDTDLTERSATTDPGHRTVKDPSSASDDDVGTNLHLDRAVTSQTDLITTTVETTDDTPLMSLTEDEEVTATNEAEVNSPAVSYTTVQAAGMDQTDLGDATGQETDQTDLGDTTGHETEQTDLGDTTLKVTVEEPVMEGGWVGVHSYGDSLIDVLSVLSSIDKAMSSTTNVGPEIPALINKLGQLSAQTGSPGSDLCDQGGLSTHLEGAVGDTVEEMIDYVLTAFDASSLTDVKNLTNTCALDTAKFLQLQEVIEIMHKRKALLTTFLSVISLFQYLSQEEKGSQFVEMLQFLHTAINLSTSQLQYVSGIWRFKDEWISHFQGKVVLVTRIKECVLNIKKEADILNPTSMETKKALVQNCIAALHEFVQFEKNDKLLSEKVLNSLEKARDIEKKGLDLFSKWDTLWNNVYGLAVTKAGFGDCETHIPDSNAESASTDDQNNGQKPQNQMHFEGIVSKGSTVCLLHMGIVQMTAVELDLIRKAIHHNSSLRHLWIIDHPMECIPALIAFITNEKMVQVVLCAHLNGDVRSILLVQKSSKQQPMLYFLRKGKTVYQHASIFMRDQLRPFLNENSIPSALDINTYEIVLFITREQEDNIRASLNAKIESIRKSYDGVPVPYRICYLDHSFEVCSESGPAACFPGSGVQFECSDGLNIAATAGALVKDDQDRMYVLSSCHGKKVYHSYLVESAESENRQKRHETKYTGEVYNSDPLLDACLMEIDNEKLRGMCDPCVPGMKSAFCGPYTGRTEDLQYKAVTKYGRKTKLTKGIVTYYEFELPSSNITNALIITPDKGSSSFTQEGDSGSVIFRRTPETHQQNSNIPHHEAIAMHSSAISGYRPPVPTWSLAFRLDDVFKGFEQKLGRKFQLLQVETRIQGDTPLDTPEQSDKVSDGLRTDCSETEHEAEKEQNRLIMPRARSLRRNSLQLLAAS